MNTKDNQEVKHAIRRFINDSISIEGLGDDEDLFASGIVNSLFAVQLMTFVERTYGLEISMDDLDIENFNSINATSDFIFRKTIAKTG